MAEAVREKPKYKKKSKHKEKRKADVLEEPSVCDVKDSGSLPAPGSDVEHVEEKGEIVQQTTEDADAVHSTFSKTPTDSILGVTEHEIPGVLDTGQIPVASTDTENSQLGTRDGEGAYNQVSHDVIPDSNTQEVAKIEEPGETELKIDKPIKTEVKVDEPIETEEKIEELGKIEVKIGQPIETEVIPEKSDTILSGIETELESVNKPDVETLGSASVSGSESDMFKSCHSQLDIVESRDSSGAIAASQIVEEGSTRAYVSPERDVLQDTSEDVNGNVTDPVDMENIVSSGVVVEDVIDTETLNSGHETDMIKETDISELTSEIATISLDITNDLKESVTEISEAEFADTIVKLPLEAEAGIHVDDPCSKQVVPTVKIAVEEPVEIVATPSDKRPSDPGNLDPTNNAEETDDNSQKPAVVHRKLYPRLSDMIAHQEQLKPFSDEQLRTLYYNSQLEALPKFEESFLQKVNVDRHEFYELVLNYYRARNHLVNSEQDVESLKQDCSRYTELAWLIEEQGVTVQGYCQDKYKVSQEHRFHVCKFSEEAVGDLSRSLKSVRAHIHDELSLHAYTAQQSRLQVESYIHDLYHNCPKLKDIPRNAPVRAWLPQQRDSAITNQVEMLKICVSVLFTFQRKPIKDDVFARDTRDWLKRMVASLLRVATLEDHLFILHQLLRCPAGVGRWGVSMLQVVPPVSAIHKPSWDNPLLDHFLVLLASLLSPVKGREELLYQLKVSGTTTFDSINEGKDFPWILVDSDGEEDEDPSNSWQYLSENDVVALLNQLPMDLIFRHVLYIDQINDVDQYDVCHTSEAGMMKLYAFASNVVSLLCLGLTTFSIGRYRQLNKRLGRTIGQTVNYVSDHWENFKLAIQDLPADTLQRLQIEFDQVFFRATKAILSAQRLGSWQFMADMPYRCVSMATMWKLIWLMHHGYKDASELCSSDVTLDQCKSMIGDTEMRLKFQTKLLSMPTSEAIYLLTTFANMARSRQGQDREFVEAVTGEIYDIAYVSNHTREFCSKVGRELLMSIAQEHPFIMSILLSRVNHTITKVGMVSLYLFRELPLTLWHPDTEDLDLLCAWLMEKDLVSVESQLARLVMERMNWGFNKQATELFLEFNLHQKMAVLIVEACNKHLANKHVITHFTEGVRQVASALRSQLTNEQQLSTWAWEMALRLRLHSRTHPRPVLGTPSSGPEEGPGNVELASDPVFHSVYKSVGEHGALACYLALIMTKAGHRAADFCSDGVPLLEVLVQQHHYIPACRALAYVLPLFCKTPQYLHNNHKFMHVFQTLLSADQTRKSLLSYDFPGPITKIMAEMIQHQIQVSSIPGGLGGTQVINFWLQVLTKITRWHQDRNATFLLDSLIKAAFRSSESWDMVLCFFSALVKECALGHKDQGGVLSSLVSWIATANNFPSLIETQSCEFSWMAYAVLNGETKYEEESQLWVTLQKELFENTSLPLEQLLKKVTSSLKLETYPAVGRLCIYRWAYQALDTEMDHPLLPIIWQRFFLLYLARTTTEPGLPQRGSMGEKFFESTVNISLLKRMKKRLTETADFHYLLTNKPGSALSKEDSANRDENSESDLEFSDEDETALLEGTDGNALKEFHKKLVRLYQTLSFWLDEPRLHDSKLYLPALPPQYDAERLVTIFHNQLTPWLEMVNLERVDHDLGSLANSWVDQTSHDASRGRRGSLQAEPSNKTASERILERLHCNDTPVPPPSMAPVHAPVPELNSNILCDKRSLLFALRADFISLVEFAKVFSMRVSKNVALDCAYLELLPGLFKNEMTEVTLSIPCQSTFNPTHRCKGPAQAACRYEAVMRDDLISRKVDENRAEYKQLVIESLLPPPQIVCSAAVHVENAINGLIKLSQSSGNETEHLTAVEVGTALFYHLATYVSEDTKYYTPTRQFFSSCIENLGRVFILNNPNQSQPLLQTILQNPSLAGLLAPNFTPNATPELFVTMYEDMLPVPSNQGPEVAFTLLTKFDVTSWLRDCNPPLSQRSLLAEVIGKAVYSCSKNSTSETSRLVFGVYRSHLQILFVHQFPDHYGDVLKILLKGSSKQELNPAVWFDILRCMGCDTSDCDETWIGQVVTELHQPSPQHLPLTLPHMKESLEWMSSYFFRQRVSDTDTASFGLYPHWKMYIPALASFFAFLSHNSITQTAANVQAGHADAQHSVSELWQQLMEVFAPWIQPLDNNGQILSPWIDSDLEPAERMVTTFTQVVAALEEQFHKLLLHGSKDALRHLWPYYALTLAKPGTPDHVLQVFHTHLPTLPWKFLIPDIPALELMLQLHEKHARSCFTFVGKIASVVDWGPLLECYIGNDSPDNVVHVHVLFFTLLVKMAKDTHILENTELPDLLMAAEQFSWNYLDAISYDTTVDWFLNNANPRCVLAERTAHSARILSVMKEASGFVRQPNAPLHPETPLKRCSYVRCLVQLICRCSHLKDVNPDTFAVLVTNLLTEVETVVGTVLDPASQQQEAVSLSVEVLHLLNHCNPQGRTLGVLLTTMLGWLTSSPASLLLLPMVTAACRTLASVPHMVQVIESCMDAHFSTESAVTEGGGWGWPLAALHVPDLSHDEFLSECIKQGCYLTLYAYVLQRLPLCQNPSHELNHLTSLVSWTTKVKPRPENEGKLLLWWAKILELLNRQLDFSVSPEPLVKLLRELAQALVTLGEDKASTGLLGAIGLGKRSQLSHKFRVVCRSLAAFVLAQVPSDSSLRVIPNAPGAIRDPNRPSSPRNATGAIPSPQALQFLTQLEGTRNNKQYLKLREHVQFAVDFTSNPRNCIRDTSGLLLQLVNSLFQEEHYLSLLRPNV